MGEYITPLQFWIFAGILSRSGKEPQRKWVSNLLRLITMPLRHAMHHLLHISFIEQEYSTQHKFGLFSTY